MDYKYLLDLAIILLCTKVLGPVSYTHLIHMSPDYYTKWVEHMAEVAKL